jgi:hypothetical protein
MNSDWQTRTADDSEFWKGLLREFRRDFSDPDLWVLALLVTVPTIAAKLLLLVR